MTTVDLRRSRRLGVVCAAVAAASMLAPQQVSAEVANPNLVSSESAYIMSIPDSPKFWAAWKSNGLYDAFKKVMAMDDVEEKMADFRRELGIIEGSLGFKIDGDTLSTVLGSADIYMVPPKEDDKLRSVGIFNVTDNDKLTKLIDLAEKAAEQAASGDDESTGTEDSDNATTGGAFAESDYNGIKIKTFTPSGETGNKFVYARPEGKLIIANDEADVRLVIDRIKAATPAAGTVAASEEFKKIDAALAAEKGEFYIYGNQDLVMEMQTAGKDAPAGISAAIKSMIDNLAPLTYYGASVDFEPKEISSYSYGLIKEGTSDSLILRNPGDKPLKIANYIPSGTLLAAATSLFDAESMYKLGTQVGDSIAAESQDDSSTAAKTESVEKKLEQSEGILGFSVKNDLVPALGNEVALAINEVNFPLVDATIILGVKDRAKMQKVVDSLEKKAVDLIGASADSETSGPEFASEEVGGHTIKTMEVQFGYAPGFVLTDEFLILGSTKSALKKSIEVSASGENFTKSEPFKSLGQNITANANTLQYADMGKIISIARSITGAMAPQAAKYLEALEVLDVSGSASRVENGAAVSRGVLKLK